MKAKLFVAVLLGLWTVAPLVAQTRVPVAPHPAPPPSRISHPLLVPTDWLASRLNDPAVVVLQVGRDEAEYRAGHIPGARFVPLGSIVVERDGILNELPETDALQGVFAEAGVSDASHVVLYGDLGGLAAARAFFTLDYLGHMRVSLLDGGLERWKAEQRQLSTEAPAVQRGTFSPLPRADRVVSAGWVRQHLDDPTLVLIDARPPAQFTGEDATGLRPGHIPGARNIFWRSALLSDDDPRLKDLPELRAMFAAAGAAPGRTVVAYCRTGVQASHTYFVARYLGYDVVLYDGSFIDWSRRSELPVER
jgi:thiosulfate/3-mercaptopyruvate sulfurtransferase